MSRAGLRVGAGVSTGGETTGAGVAARSLGAERRGLVAQYATTTAIAGVVRCPYAPCFTHHLTRGAAGHAGALLTGLSRRTHHATSAAIARIDSDVSADPVAVCEPGRTK